MRRPTQARFAAAFARELAHFAALTPGRTVTSIFLGGGTPSLMQPATVAAILDAIAALWPVAPDAEITLEANPGSVEAERFRGYRAAGVNRALARRAVARRRGAEGARPHPQRGGGARAPSSSRAKPSRASPST